MLSCTGLYLCLDTTIPSIAGLEREPLMYCKGNGKSYLYKAFPDVGRDNLRGTCKCLGKIP